MLSSDEGLANAVDAVAYHWQRSVGGDRPSANPELLEGLDRVEVLAHHPLGQRIIELAKALSRGALVGVALQVAAGVPPREHPGVAESLAAFAADLRDFEARAGGVLRGLLAAERQKAYRRLAASLDGHDPLADLRHLLREPLAVEIAVVPSLLLPPPQDGRHGASHTAGGRTQSYLTFGYPLSVSPEQFGIDREFLLFGAWSYGLRVWLASAWADVLARQEGWAEARCWVAAAEGEARSAEDLVKCHLDLALRSALGQRIGTTRSQFRLMAEARGLRWFDWFADWVASRSDSGAPLREELRGLPRALLDDRAVLERARSPEFPGAINLLLMSRFRGQPQLVLPDRWPDSWCSELCSSWSALQPPLVRYRDWSLAEASGSGPGVGGPAIAVGSPEDNPLVASILERRGFGLDELDQLQDPLLVVLERPVSTGEPWFLALAARDSKAVRALPLETLLRLTSTWAWFDGVRVVRSGKEPMPAAVAGHSHDERPAV